MPLLRSLILTGFLFAALEVFAQTADRVRYSPAEFKTIPLTNLTSNRSEGLNLEDASKNIFVFVFLSPECPLCQQYSLQLNALAEQYVKDVVVIGLFPGKSYDRKTIVTFLKKYKVKFPAYIDASKKLTHYLDASVTPEVVILSKENDGLMLQYRGAIDDRVISLRTKKLKATNYYVKDAINQILSKEDILVKRTEPVGCLINDF